VQRQDTVKGSRIHATCRQTGLKTVLKSRSTKTLQTTPIEHAHAQPRRQRTLDKHTLLGAANRLTQRASETGITAVLKKRGIFKGREKTDEKGQRATGKGTYTGSSAVQGKDQKRTGNVNKLDPCVTTQVYAGRVRK
jgi:hypothetical protein